MLFPASFRCVGAGVGSVEMFDLLALWLSQESVLKGKVMVAAQDVARTVIIISDHSIWAGQGGT